MDYITIQGAREHNLKNLNLRLPRNACIVITGLSGSGKSSLAFDTIYTEGQRRYLESLSSYARQFLEKMRKADVDHITGLSPTISIEQRQMSKNPRSTVGTVTEIYDYLRLLYAKIGDLHCYQCGNPVGAQTSEEICVSIRQQAAGHPVLLFAPLVRGRKGIYKDLFAAHTRKGFTIFRVDKKMYEAGNLPKLKKTVRHDIDIGIDRFTVAPSGETRIRQSVETALSVGNGICGIIDDMTGAERIYSQKLTCPTCSISYRELTPNLFSFNSPYGACARCHGLGKISRIQSRHIITDPDKPLLKGALNKEIFFLLTNILLMN